MNISTAKTIYLRLQKYQIQNTTSLRAIQRTTMALISGHSMVRTAMQKNPTEKPIESCLVMYIMNVTQSSPVRHSFALS